MDVEEIFHKKDFNTSNAAFIQDGRPIDQWSEHVQMDLSRTTNIKTLKPKAKQQYKMVDWKLVATTVSSRIVGIRRRMEGMTMCSHDETKTHNEQNDERVKGRGGGRQSLKNIDGDVPMCVIKNKDWIEIEEDWKNESRGRRQTTLSSRRRWRTNVCAKERRRKWSEIKRKRKGQQQQSKIEGCSKKSKRAEGVKAKAHAAAAALKRTRQQVRQSEKDITFIVLQKNVRSLNSSERIEELTQGLEECRWDAFLISETANNAKDTCSWELENSRTNTEWNSGEKKAENVSTTNNIYCWWVYTSSTRGMQTTTLKRYTDQSRNPRNSERTTYQLWELGPGFGVERVSVGPHTLGEGNKKGDWMKQWLMIQNFTVTNTMYRKKPEKEAFCRTTKGTEKQMDYSLVDRKHIYWSRDAEQTTWSTWEATTQKNAHRHEENFKNSREHEELRWWKKRDPMKQTNSKSATPNSIEK